MRPLRRQGGLHRRQRGLPPGSRKPFPGRPGRLLPRLCAGWPNKNDSLGIDPSRIAVGGISSGGGLAASVAQRARDEHGPRLALQLLVLPDLGLALAVGLHDALHRHPILGLARAIGSCGSTTWPASEHQPAYAAPALATSFADLPPAMLVVAEFDPLRDEALALRAGLAHAKVSVELHLYSGTYHAFDYIAPFAQISQRALADQVNAWPKPYVPEPRHRFFHIQLRTVHTGQSAHLLSEVAGAWRCRTDVPTGRFPPTRNSYTYRRNFIIIKQGEEDRNGQRDKQDGIATCGARGRAQRRRRRWGPRPAYSRCSASRASAQGRPRAGSLGDEHQEHGQADGRHPRQRRFQRRRPEGVQGVPRARPASPPRLFSSTCRPGWTSSNRSRRA